MSKPAGKFAAFVSWKPQVLNLKFQMPPLPRMLPPTFREFTGVAVSAGKMNKVVRVRLEKQEWNKRIRKFYPAPYEILVSDPTNSVREGDVIKLRNGLRVSKTIHHVVTSIVAPFGTPLSERPPLMTEYERRKQYLQERIEKDRRQAERGRGTAIKRLKAMMVPSLAVLRRQGKISEEDAKVPEGGPPGGEARVGPINNRARHNIAQAKKLVNKGLENEAQRVAIESGFKRAGNGREPLYSQILRESLENRGYKLLVDDLGSLQQN